MRYLLDTHVLLWYIQGEEKIPNKVLSILQNPANTIFLSTVSIWEITIKSSNGRLDLGMPIADFIKVYIEKSSIKVLGLKNEYYYELNKLPFIHKDPFDRIIASTAVAESCILLTDDTHLKQYENIITFWN